MSKINVCEMVTERIIAELEKGIIPWQRPWTGTKQGAYSRSTGKPYSLLNQFLLGKPGEWLTFNQAKEAGGHIKKGEKSSIVVFYKPLPIEEENADGKKEIKVVPLLRYYNVFHIDQCEGIEPKYQPEKIAETFDPLQKAEELTAAYCNREGVKLNIRTSNRAFYSPDTDAITMPLREQFPVREEFYSTLFHELTHSTGHKKRLNRLNKTAAFGNEEYSKEELVAEIGAATIINRLGLESPKSFRNSAAYIQSWINALKNDKRLIISAASKANKAISLIFNETLEELEV